MSVAKRARIEATTPAKDPFAVEFLEYIDATPTPFHLCEQTITRLEAKGFAGLDEKESWIDSIKPGGKYYFTRNGSTIVAFTVGNKFVSGNPFKTVGGHTDSPVLKVKPVSKRTKDGYIQVGVECYGGGLWHTWFDRELTVAGRVIIKTAQGFESKIVKVDRPILRVPNLCIHLQTGEERAAFKVNKETHLQPIFAMVNDTLNKDSAAVDDNLDNRHIPSLLKLLAQEIGCDAADIKDLELSLCDTQLGQIWGANNEFLSSPRLDNQVHCFTAMKALLAHADAGLENDNGISMIALFDHEEIGSLSAQGACSPIFKDAIIRISESLEEGFSNTEKFKISLSKSMLISADVAHAIHPNYASKHEQCHQPKLNCGTVLKTNDNQRYATDAVSGFFFRQLARQIGQPVQEFMVRNDCPCGTTIGPIISANTGLRTVDIGVPSLSMHSIRETIGVKDITNNYEILKGFFANYETLRNGFVGF